MDTVSSLLKFFFKDLDSPLNFLSLLLSSVVLAIILGHFVVSLVPAFPITFPP